MYVARSGVWKSCFRSGWKTNACKLFKIFFFVNVRRINNIYIQPPNVIQLTRTIIFETGSKNFRMPIIFNYIISYYISNDEKKKNS